MKNLFFLLLGSLVTPAFSQTGIGTNAPVNNLDVVGASAAAATSGSTANGVLRIQKSGGNAALDAGVNGTTNAWIQARDASNYANSNNLLLNPSGGKVAINGGEGNEILTVNGNIYMSGSVKAAQAGQVLNSVVLNESDLSKSSATSVANTRSTVVSYNYTPVSSNSKIFVTFNGEYGIGGSGNDDWYSFLMVGNSTIQTRQTFYENSAGGGGRATSLLPISGVYTNSGTSSLTIKVDVQEAGGDDTFTLEADMILTITEVAR